MGLLGDLLGSAANTATDILDKDIAHNAEMERQAASQKTQLENQKTMADYNANLQKQRDIEVEKLKVTLAEELRQGQMKRLQGQIEQVEKDTPVVTEERKGRKLATAQQTAPSLTAETMGLISQKLSPAQMRKYYGVKQDTPVDAMDDQITAAARSGSLDALAALKEQRKGVVEQMKLDQDRDIADQKEVTANNRIDATLRGQELRHQDFLARLEKLGAGGGGAHGEALKYIDGERKALQADANDLRKAYEAEVKANQYDEAKKAELKQSFDAARAEMDKRRKQLDADFTELRSKVGLSPAAGADAKKPDAPKEKPDAPKAMPDLPAGAKQIGTSDGKAVYELPNGKRVIAK